MMDELSPLWLPGDMLAGPDPAREARTLCERERAHRAMLDRGQSARPPAIAARRLVQVYNGGAMPSSPDHVYLTHPVELDGVELEGGTASTTVETSTTIPVVVLWNAPNAGDILTAYAVGGRWVTERGGGSGATGYPCGSCLIPAHDLTVSWTNSILGDGSTTLAYSSGTWTSGCSNELIYQLLCTSNQVDFRVIYFISGPCPTGTRQYCSTLRPTPFRLTQTGPACGANFLLTCTVGATACPILSANGFSNFTVSDNMSGGGGEFRM
jgi:hypothetical protein